MRYIPTKPAATDAEIIAAINAPRKACPEIGCMGIPTAEDRAILAAIRAPRNPVPALNCMGLPVAA